MKYLFCFLAILVCESVYSESPATIQKNKTYDIRNEKRPFIPKPMRKYLKSKKGENKKIIINQTTPNNKIKHE